MKNRINKNLLIAGTSLSIAITLLTVFIFGYEIWLTLPGIAMAVTQIILAFGFSAISLRMKQAVFIKSGNTGLAPLPMWVFVWQAIAVLVFCVLLVVFYLQSKQ